MPSDPGHDIHSDAGVQPSLVRVSNGRGVLIIMLGRSRMIIDPRAPQIPGRSMSVFHPTRQTSLVTLRRGWPMDEKHSSTSRTFQEHRPLMFIGLANNYRKHRSDPSPPLITRLGV